MKNQKTPRLNQMSRDEINIHLQALKQLLKQATTNSLNFVHEGDEYLGICYHLREAAMAAGSAGNVGTYRVLVEIARDWPQRSDVLERPVPHMDDPWQGEGLRLRISLMRYIIKRLRDRLRRMP